MSFFAPQIGISFYNEVPVICSQCGYSETRHGLTQSVKEALIDTTSLRRLTIERELLERTASLFHLFPKTRHPLLVDKKCRNPKNRLKASPDPDVDTALDRDIELKMFLTDCGFDLDARIAWIDQRLSHLESYRFRADVKCSKCDGFVYLPDDFYGEVGTYMERLKERNPNEN